jgi:hypothetical protein
LTGAFKISRIKTLDSPIDAKDDEIDSRYAAELDDVGLAACRRLPRERFSPMTPSSHQLCAAAVETLWFSGIQPPEARGSIDRHVQSTIRSISLAATGVGGGQSN